MPLAATTRWLRTAVLATAMAWPGPMAGVAAGPAAGAAIAAAAAVVTVPGVAEAQGRVRSSGGYSRPAGRTPSFSAPGGTTRTPSLGGGYRRPTPGLGADRPSPGAPSASDRAISRRSSREALERFRAPPDAPPGGLASPAPAPVPDGRSGASRRRGAYDDWYPDRRGWFGSRGWSPPRYALGTRPRFGIWDGLFLWFLLDTLNQPGHAAFFHHHQDDPGYREWRAEAEQRAAEDPELREQLARLDARLAELSDQPRNPDFLPPGTPPEAAIAEPRDVAPGGLGLFLLPLLVGGGVFYLLWYRGRQVARNTGRLGQDLLSGSGTAGRGAPGLGLPGRLGQAAEIVRRRVSGETYTPSLFRVGMTITLDPAPFILARGMTKVTPPEPSGTATRISVEAVGTVDDSGTTLYRLYLPGARNFFQLRLDALGNPDECRYFSHLDEVNPASKEEWGVWLDPAEGMIGWPEFQTKDGKLYARQWGASVSREPPRRLDETIERLGGTTARHGQAMLYAAPTGAAEPAPQTEYILVAAIEQGAEAWVDIHAGLDVNPAALSLA